MTESSTTLTSGTVLADRYQITAEIGRGGFGMVYRARQLNIDRDVAIKVLPPRFMTSPEVVERFRREAHLSSRLRHPNTITIHDYGRHDDFLFIVMEYLHGEDLADLLERDQRPGLERIVHIARQVLRSLAEAHDQGIVHRDLKPENIFLSVLGDERDFVKVLDFGIAKLAMPETAESAGGRKLTLSGSTVGTPIYMSPEQAAGEEVDNLTDLYALGVIIYEMINGKPPFSHPNPVKVMRSHLFDPVPPFADPALHGSAIERVVLRALQKDKADRFQSAHEFLAALDGNVVRKPRPVAVGVPMAGADEPPTLEMTEDQLGDIEGDLMREIDRAPTSPQPTPGAPRAGHTIDVRALSAARRTSDRRVHGVADYLGVPDSPARVTPPTLASADAVPFHSPGLFDDVDRAREPVRQASSRSALSERSDLRAPAGFSSDANTSNSAIITILDPAPAPAVDDEVIVLTRPKAITPILRAASFEHDVSTGEHAARIETPGAPLSSAAGSTTDAPPGATPPVATTPDTTTPADPTSADTTSADTTSADTTPTPEGASGEDWAWGASVPGLETAPDASRELATKRARSSMMLILVLAIAAFLAVGVWLFLRSHAG